MFYKVIKKERQVLRFFYCKILNQNKYLFHQIIKPSYMVRTYILCSRAIYIVYKGQEREADCIVYLNNRDCIMEYNFLKLFGCISFLQMRRMLIVFSKGSFPCQFFLKLRLYQSVSAYAIFVYQYTTHSLILSVIQFKF